MDLRQLDMAADFAAVVVAAADLRADTRFAVGKQPFGFDSEDTLAGYEEDTLAGEGRLVLAGILADCAGKPFGKVQVFAQRSTCCKLK